MGRGGNRGRGRGRGRGGGGGREAGCGGEDNRVSFDKTPKSNQNLEKYYNQVLGLSEEEKDEFWGALKRELPNSFRFAGSKGHALAVQKQLVERYIPEISKISHYDGTKVEPPQPVPWYPDNLAWWMTTPKNVVRKFPPFSAFQKYLVSETSVGNISRQEVVSMIPPLVMDLQPGMTVLDLCASPGSKAAQLLEMVHRGEEYRVHQSLRDHATEDGREISPGVDESSKWDSAALADVSDDGRATGLLIANDKDYKRAHMLIHQLKRLSSPNLIVTNHDATMYPSIKLPPTPENPSLNRYLKFDRILADVPCSGDGTTRKNVNLWQDWTPSSALGLHVTQVRILVRSLQMLKPGGRVVYSTCSMNPVENEAVVASAIERCGGLEKVALLPTQHMLPLLKRKPGLKNWSVIDKMGRIWNSFKEVEDDNAKNDTDFAKEKLVENMFAPLPDSPGSKIPFENCIRVYAHLQDTGGFFISVLEKKSEFRALPESEPKKAVTDTSPTSQSPDPDTSLIGLLEAKLDQSEPEANKNGIKRSADAIDEDSEKLSSAKKLKTEVEENDATEIQNEEFKKSPIPLLEPQLKPESALPTKQFQQRNRSGQQFEEPFKYISGDHPEVQVVVSFYKLSPRFPRDRFMVRNAQGEPAKTIYYTSALIRDILTENEGKGIKFVHGGVKMFMKQDVQGEGVCKWRIQSEGMPILEGYVGEERVVRLYKKDTLRKLLIEMFPKLAEESWKNLGEIGERVNNIGMGCCVLRIEPSDAEDGFQERIVLPLWRSLHSLNLMLAKEDRTAMLLRIFNDTSPLLNNHMVGKNKQLEEAKSGAEVVGVKTESVDEPEKNGDVETAPESKDIEKGLTEEAEDPKATSEPKLEEASSIS
ncbi:S-adenosyl-L-methionine-dependent methyltransferase [Bisporella sp. PMI_857]|nr:S-adenosyl-L-methionine-dependent methyltransferase [Bisporella sp. PMI_857]